MTEIVTVGTFAPLDMLVGVLDWVDGTPSPEPDRDWILSSVISEL